MATVVPPVVFVDEIADFFASRPSRDQVLAYRPSPAVERRFTELLEKLRDGELTGEEQMELNQFQQTEVFLRLVKARLRGESVRDA